MSPPDLAYSPPRSASIASLFPAPVSPDVAPGLLSEAALYLRQHIPRRSHRSGNVLYPQSFTVRDLKNTLHNYISNQTCHKPTPALVDSLVASLELQCFLYHSTWKHMAVASEDDVCMFLYCDEGEEDEESEEDSEVEPPTGVFPCLAKCYSPTCDESNPCYTPRCPNNQSRQTRSSPQSSSPSQSRCYSDSCRLNKGPCYSPTCPTRYALSPESAPLTPIFTPPPFSRNSTQSSVETQRVATPPPNPIASPPPELSIPPQTHIEPIMVISIIGPSITWIDQYYRPLATQPCDARRPLSFYLKGLGSERGGSDLCIEAAY